MFRLKNVEIKGFWGQYTIETDFNQDVNIFIGRNGTGKTTFINLLQAVIVVDLELLYNLQFESITINLFQKNKKRKIEVVKKSDGIQYKDLHYSIGTKKFQLPILPESELKYLVKRNGRIHPRFFIEVQNIRDEISELINVSYLSVNRSNIVRDELRDVRKEDIYNAIDLRLEDLIDDLTRYQFYLESELSKHSKKFQEDVLKSMLYNEDFDQININEKITIDTKKINTGLRQAYRGLGILDTETEKAIENHIEAIINSAKSINDYNEDRNKPVYPNDVTPLTLLRRTKRINDLSSELESKKKNLFERLEQYIKLLNEFHETKDFILQDNKVGGLTIKKDDKDILLSQLSSGEKQLIILLTETLLQKGSETLFIADEPELSLHIEWQRKVISSIRKLNPNSQIIVATHSPEIVGKFKESTINMERILNG